MLQVIGAGLGRTGTKSLKGALEQLLGGPCYHMTEVFAHPDHIPLWTKASQGKPLDWSRIFKDYVATVDWPSCAFWPELSSVYPNALVILSTRNAEAWWKSASSTIFPTIRDTKGPWRTMIDTLFEHRFTSETTNREACIEAFQAHNQQVREAGLGARLLEWTPADGWDPLCRALELDRPDSPFPHDNSTAEFLQRHRSSSGQE